MIHSPWEATKQPVKNLLRSFDVALAQGVYPADTFCNVLIAKSLCKFAAVIRDRMIRAIIEDFATRLVPGGIVIYAGDTGETWGYFDAPLLAGLGVNVESWQNAGRGVALPGAPLVAAGRVRDQSRPG
jgi:BsuBI/PstI restriction endonuclease domain